MNRRLCLLVLLAGMLTCGCPSANMRTPRSVRIGANDTYIHPGSKMPFPPSVGYFQRGEVTQYEPREKDVGVGYNLHSIRYQIAITVYVYPAPVTSIGSPDNVVEAAYAWVRKSHFEGIKGAVTDLHPDAVLVSEGPTTMKQDQVTYPGLKAVLEYEGAFFGREQMLGTHAYLFNYGKWFVKYRISYPKDSEEMALSRVEDFMVKFKWSESDAPAGNEPESGLSI
jgi:hypothetical protein